MLRTVTRHLFKNLTISSPVASSSQSFATHAEPPFIPSTAGRRRPSSKHSKNPFIVPSPVIRPKAPRVSHRSSRVRGRTGTLRSEGGKLLPTPPRKSLSVTPLAKDAEGAEIPGSYEQSSVGQVKIYLPSVFMRLVRNTEQHADDPYTATFRTDLRLTKPDISNYLKNIYGLAITSIRTINYMSSMKRSAIGGGYSRTGGTKNYKKVLVTLQEPFWYPEERGRAWCNDHFSRDKMEEMRDRKMLRIGDGQKYGVSSHRYRGPGKSVAEQARLKAAFQAVSEEGGTSPEFVGELGRSAFKRPEGLRKMKNVLRSKEERVGIARTKVEIEMDALKNAGW